MPMRLLIIVSLTLASFLSLAREELLQGCNDCHGTNGVSQQEQVPTIAGMSAFYLEEAMLAYQEGARACPPLEWKSKEHKSPAPNMCELARELTAEQLQWLVQQYSEMPFVATKQGVDPDMVERGRKLHDRLCERCHSEAGSVADDDAGILAGQWLPALRFMVQDMLDGTRPTSEKMLIKLREMTDDDVEAVLNYYAAQQ